MKPVLHINTNTIGISPIRPVFLPWVFNGREP